MQTYLLTEATFNLVLSWGRRNPTAIELELDRELQVLLKFQDKLDLLRSLGTEILKQIAALPSDGILGSLGHDSMSVAYASKGEEGTVPTITSISVSSFRAHAVSAQKNLYHLMHLVKEREASLTDLQESSVTPLTIVGTQVNAVGVVLMAIDAGLFDDKITDAGLAGLFRAEPNRALTEEAISSVRQKLGGNSKTADRQYVEFVLCCLRRLSLKQLRKVYAEIEKLIDSPME